MKNLINQQAKIFHYMITTCFHLFSAVAAVHKKEEEPRSTLNGADDRNNDIFIFFIYPSDHLFPEEAKRMKRVSPFHP